MSQFRKKPIVIEAWHWTFDGKGEKEPNWFHDAANKGCGDVGGLAFEPDHRDGPRITIATLEGVMLARPGDWIIQGVKGEIYPCKPDIFEQITSFAEPHRGL